MLPAELHVFFFSFEFIKLHVLSRTSRNEILRDSPCRTEQSRKFCDGFRPGLIAAQKKNKKKPSLVGLFLVVVICSVVFPGQLRPRLAYRGGIVHCVTHRPTAAPVCSSLSSLRLLPSGSRQAAHSCVAAAPPLSLGADVPSDLCSGLRQHNRAVCELGQPRRSVRRPNQVGSPSN